MPTILKRQVINPTSALAARNIVLTNPAETSSIVKYACRWKRKHVGNLDDLRKIFHYAALLIAMELESPDAREEDEFRSERKFNTFSDEADIVRVENV